MIEYLNPTGINTFQNSLQLDGQIIHAVNVYNPGIGIIAKRPGYGTFLGTLGAQVNSLFSFPHQDGTTLQLYAAAGSILSYSLQGTGAWTTAQGSQGGDAGGTITNGNHVGYAILNNVMIIGDGAGSTRHTTNGTQFLNTSLAPIAQYLTQFHNRIYASDGTSSTLTYSSSGSANNWSISAPADSSSFTVPDEGAITKSFVAGDRLMITKNKGKMFNWDDYTLVDMATKYGPSSPYSVANIDQTWFYLNQLGIFQHDGANKQLISNAIQNQFYNSGNTGIGTASWGTAPGEAYLWDYLVAVGTITDNFTGRQINNAIIKYDFLKNQFHNWSFNNPPTAFHSYIDASNKRQLIFGDATGQVYQLDPTKTSDNGNAIQSEIVLLFNYASQQTQLSATSASMVSGTTYEEKWNWLRLIFNPGDEVNIQFAFANSLTYQHLRWSEILNIHPNANGDYWQEADGVVEIRFPDNLNNPRRSRFLFVRIYDDSDNSQWKYYGCSIDADPQIIK